MGNIVAKFDIDKLFEGVYAKVEDIQDAVIEAIKAACLQTVANARRLDTYKDLTTLLRSSIGFVIYDHGTKVADNFEARNGEKGSEGAALGKRVAEQAAASWPNSIVAVVVAGADYALYVESKGYDVISGPCSELNAILSKYIQIAIEELRA